MLTRVTVALYTVAVATLASPTAHSHRHTHTEREIEEEEGGGGAEEREGGGDIRMDILDMADMPRKPGAIVRGGGGLL